MTSNIAPLLARAFEDEGLDVPRRRVELVALRLTELIEDDREQRHAAYRARTAHSLYLEDL